MILVGTGPRGGDRMARLAPDVAPLFGKVYDSPDLMWLPILFFPSESSQAAGRNVLERIRARTKDGDVPVSDVTADAHLAAAREWGRPRGSYDYLKEIPHPALVVNGNNDIVVATVNSYILQQNLPNAELILFPETPTTDRIFNSTSRSSSARPASSIATTSPFESPTLCDAPTSD